MEADEKEIRKLVQAWMAATEAGELEKVFEMMTDDAVFLRPGKAPMVGKAAFIEQAKPQMKPGGPRFTGKSDLKEVRVDGDHAYVWSHLQVVTTPPGGGTGETRSGNTLTVFRREDGRWLLARDANMLA